MSSKELGGEDVVVDDGDSDGEIRFQRVEWVVLDWIFRQLSFVRR